MSEWEETDRAERCMELGGAVCRLTPVYRTGDYLAPGVYLAVIPEEGDHDDSEDVIGVLATQPVKFETMLGLMQGASLEDEDAAGCYWQRFDSFADMALTLGQGLRAVEPGVGGQPA